MAVSQENNEVSSTVLVINSLKVFENSDLGKDIISTFQKSANQLEKEANINVKRFEREELELTKKRDKINKKEFNKLAEDFDTRVQKTRSLYDIKDSQLKTKMEMWKKKFFEFSGRIIQPIMMSYKAFIVLDVNQQDLFFDNRIDITNQVITQLDDLYSKDPKNLKLIIEE
tara:strand:+ start:363 stop:875 length:513 start_codon:yes stop_codon:yes gene_type:complete